MENKASVMSRRTDSRRSNDQKARTDSLRNAAVVTHDPKP